MVFYMYYFLVGVLLLKYVTSKILATKNNRLLKSYQYDHLPDVVQKLFTTEQFQKMVAYNLDKSRFSDRASLIMTLVIMGLSYPAFIQPFYQLYGQGLWQQVFLLLSITLILLLAGAVKDYFFQFTIESHYGFNKSSRMLWLRDLVIKSILSLLFSGIVFGLLLYLSQVTVYWWLISACVLLVFFTFLLVIAPYVILPLFNKFTELPDGALKEELLQLAQDLDFGAQGIYVMDGSKRSAHSNAYFTGLGKFKRIVLFDTLIEQMSVPEIKAVLAHEIGHYKRAHVTKNLLLFAVEIFVEFGIVALLQTFTGFYLLLGFGQEQVGSLLPLLLYGIFYGSAFHYFTSPISNRVSRKFEYEADAFARQAMGGDGQFLVDSLSKLTTKGMGNPLPHAAYSSFYYSHPTFMERREALLKDS